MLRGLRLRSLPLLAGLLASVSVLTPGCKQEEGGRCQIDTDCNGGLVCDNPTGVDGICRSPGGTTPQQRDASAFLDVAPIVDGPAADASRDGGSEAAPAPDGAASEAGDAPTPDTAAADALAPDVAADSAAGDAAGDAAGG